MKKVVLYFGAVVMLFVAIFVINNNNGKETESQTLASNQDFVGDENYNIEEDLDVPKVIFVYSDPTPHHPQG
ncbi:hypothetical protein [Bacillus sp. PS06]|uniref:hypothetical protein n=1 Tax=Bacillus sp. PS06 TaxID=2764176 RepID=UPI00177EF35B|nr:hypothetical protein [Bacillus sp. PS06]MBD8067789.1 hypothetical protein [Bacillus sp. PS06]